jgi:hypothetical protein
VPSLDDRIIEEASVWHRIWKPFLNESVGWFIGGFLILVGTLYWVADAWDSMSGTTRSFTVFAFAGAWTLGFAAWARFLTRRESTRAAGRVLELIAAAVAPLAPIALGPIAGSSPLLFFPALLGWSALAFALARRASSHRDPDGAGWHAMSAAITTALMGAAPLVATSSSAVWLTLLPLAAFFAASRLGPRGPFALLAPLYLLALFVLRLRVALAADGVLPAPGTWAPLVAAAAYAALHLRRSQKTDAVAIAAVCLQLVLLVTSAFGDPPAFFITACLLCATSLKLLPESPRWVYPAYAGAYFAFQTCGQLVPSQLKVLVAHLRQALGYSATEALPAAYDAVYTAIFVVLGGALAAWLLHKDEKDARAPALLTATGWAASLVGAMGLMSVWHDARPALWSAPCVAALCLALGARFKRVALSWVGAALSGCSAIALLCAYGADAGGVAVATLALALAAATAFTPQRAPFAVGAGALVLTALAAAFVHPASVSGLAAVVLASAAALLVARSVGSDDLTALAFFVPACVAPKLALVVAPHFIAPLLAVSALTLAAVSRWKRPAAMAAVISAIAAPLYQLSTGTSAHGQLGVTLLVCALAFFLALRTVAGRAAAIVFTALALLPIGGDLQPLPFITPQLASVLALVAALGSSVHAALRGRRAETALIASLAVALSLTCGLGQTALVFAALTALLSTRALVPAVTIPLAVALAAGSTLFAPLWLLAIGAVTTALSLLGSGASRAVTCSATTTSRGRRASRPWRSHP